MKQHILIVDDDKDELTIFLEALKKIPADDGFKCTYASSAKQALEMLHFLVPDYIFVDLNMPGTDGLHFLSSIKQFELRRTKIFLYSTTITVETQNRAMALGAYECLQKPNTIEELTTSLESIFIPRLAPVYSINDIERFDTIDRWI